MGGALRFKDNCLVIWVKCDQEILDERCDKRVDKMMDRGMIKELEDFHEVRRTCCDRQEMIRPKVIKPKVIRPKVIRPKVIRPKYF